MRNLKSRGRSKQFEKDIEEAIAEEEADARQVVEAEEIAEEIEGELEKLRIEDFEAGGETEQQNSTPDDEDKAGQAVNVLNTKPVTTPAPARHRNLDLETSTPRPATSGKPSHRRRRDQSTPTSDSAPLPPSPSPTPQQPRERFIFTNPRLYSHARALFATTSQPDHPSSLRWGQVATLLTSHPINCCVVPARNGGAGATVIRPARTVKVVVNGHGEGEDGSASEGREVEVHLEKRSVVLHRPHGNENAWVERHVLENMASSLMGRFGWERGDFVWEGEE